MVGRIAAGRTDLVLDHLAAGGDPRAVDSGGVSLLEWTAYYGDVTALRQLLERGASLASLGADFGLVAAAFHGHWRLCEFLLERGADPNAALPETGETALHAALCKPGRPAYDLVVEVLLARGADPNRATRPGAPTGQFMRDVRTKGETALHRAAAFASEAVIERLLATGAEREARDAAGDTPLTWASWHTRPDAILRRLCFGDHRIHPERRSTFDHGVGVGEMERSLLGRPIPVPNEASSAEPRATA
ncbi:MAG: ankyrin repeat domain-containing protein [Planctomycetes bacterium]|nr:ankyrin repeat domain-containing protein [Planctomycetota bacterium]